MSKPILYSALPIEGQLVAGEGLPEAIINPACGEVLASIAEASLEQLEAAVKSAHSAFAGWSRATPAQRATALLAIAGAIEQNADQLARMESLNCGSRCTWRARTTFPPQLMYSASLQAPCAANRASWPANTCPAIPAWCAVTRWVWSPRLRRGTIR